MSLTGTITTTVEIKSPAYSFYNIFKSQMNKLSTISPHLVEKIELLKGDWDTEGAVMKWYYTLEGVTLTETEIKEKIDDENMSITWNVIGGDIMDLYKTFIFKLQVTATDNGGALVTWINDFEKLDLNDVPVPNAYLDYSADLTKDVDAYLLAM